METVKCVTVRNHAWPRVTTQNIDSGMAVLNLVKPVSKFAHLQVPTNSWTSDLLQNLKDLPLSKKHPHFTEPEISLQYLQQPDKSYPYSVIQFLRCILILPFPLHLVLSSCFLPLSPPKSPIQSSPLSLGRSGLLSRHSDSLRAGGYGDLIPVGV